MKILVALQLVTTDDPSKLDGKMIQEGQTSPARMKLKEYKLEPHDLIHGETKLVTVFENGIF